MKEYVISIIFAIMVCLGTGLLTPSEKYKGIVRIVCGLFVVYTILSPLKALTQTDFSFDIGYEDTDNSFDSLAKSAEENLKNNISENAEKILSHSISEELSELTGNAVTVRVGEDTLYISGVSSSEEQYVKKYVLEQYGICAVFE